MMHQTAAFSYANVKALNAHVLEMAYGVEDRLKVLFMLPRKGDTLNNMMRNLQAIGLQPIFDELEKSQLEFEGEDVDVLLPRFTTKSDFALDSILDQMGLGKLFTSSAELSLIAPDTFLSRTIHKAQIEVDEEGTVASAATGKRTTHDEKANYTIVCFMFFFFTGFSFGNKNTPPKFNANRPFSFVIVDKATNLLLFCGKVINVG